MPTASSTSVDDTQKNFIKTNRPDGRSGGSSIRPLTCEASCLTRPDGSAKYSSGYTQILSAVYGPAAPRQSSKENPSKAIVAVVFKQSNRGDNQSGETSSSKKLSGGGAHIMTEREMERFIGESISSCICLEKYPRCIIEIVIQVMKADGSVVGTSLNAAVVALLDAGIHMKSIPIATTCLLDFNTSNSLMKINSRAEKYELKLDPVAEEELTENCTIIVLVTDSVQSNKGIISSVTLGSMTLDSFVTCMSASSTASKAVLAFIRLAVEQKCARELETLLLI